MCNHMVKAGGKRIRPLLVLYSGLVFSGLNDKLIDASVAAELIHMASLAHDDIIDNSDFRRSKPSVNHLWGNHFSVLCGDYLFASAFGILSGGRLLQSLDLMIEAIENMCAGEIIQAENKFKHDMDIGTYYKQITGKTAVFFQCCCKSGASLGCASPYQVKALGEYGLNMGIAFQIIDDILDFRGNAKVMGKPAGEDLRQGVITLPVILLLNDIKYGSMVGEMIRSHSIEARDIETVNNFLDQSGALEEAFAIAGSHIDKARECLSILPQNDFTGFLDTLPDMLQPVELQQLKLSHAPKESAHMII
jgi:heptaprenyl diphosphate synthase